MGATGAPTVARPKGRPPTNRDLVTIKVDRVLASRLRLVAQARGLTVADVVETGLRPYLDKEVVKVFRESEGKA